MNNILFYSEPVVNKILTGNNSKIINILFISLIIYALYKEPSNTQILLFYNKYFIILYLLLIFFTALYNPIIAILLSIYFNIIINKVMKFYQKTNYKSDNVLGGRKESHYFIRNPLSYFIY